MIDLQKYQYIRVATCSPELRVADVDFNKQKIIEAIKIAEENNCSIISFPEIAITAYTCQDLFFQSHLLEEAENALVDIADYCKGSGITCIIGVPITQHGKLFNCAAVISEGEIKGLYSKINLSNSQEFYEERWFSADEDRRRDTIKINGKEVAFGGDLIFDIPNYNTSLAVEICEDLWSIKVPSFDQSMAGASLLFNLSASNEILGKANYRRDLVRTQSGRCFASYIYCSSGVWESGNDLVFSGHCMISENGRMLKESKRFSFKTEIVYQDIDIEYLLNERKRNNSFGYAKPEKEFRAIEINIKQNPVEELIRPIPINPFLPRDPRDRDEYCQEIIDIQTSGLLRRLKHINSDKLILGISGGLDSTMALMIAFLAFDKANIPFNNIIAISMPGLGTSRRTKNNAEDLSKLLKTDFRTISIEKAVKQHFKDIDHDIKKHDIVYENTQARERTQILFDLANKEKALLIGTGDLSENALGWATYNGDHMSQYALNVGLTKTQIQYVIAWLSENSEKKLSKLLDDILDTPISPELLPAKEEIISQETEKSVGPYELNDFFLYYTIRLGLSPEKVLLLAQIAFKDKFDKEHLNSWLKKFYSRFFSQQFKRSCMPDGIKVGAMALSPRGDWRMPSDSNSYTWLKDLD